MFQKRFGHRLAELGYAVAWKGDNFEIAGIDRSMIERFSLRTRQIDQAANTRGITDAHDKDKLGAWTRERKQKHTTMPELRTRWRERLTDDEREAMGRAALRQRHPLDGRHGDLPATDNADERIRGDNRQRQRVASHERARASYATSSPALTLHGKVYVR